MSLWKPLRIGYIKTTDLTHGYQGSVPARLLRFYALWAPIYDLTVRLDPAYPRNAIIAMFHCLEPGGRLPTGHSLDATPGTYALLLELEEPAELEVGRLGRIRLDVLRPGGARIRRLQALRLLTGREDR
jgi:hypothetical protein